MVNVPATIIKSEWRGEARKIIPKRSISYRLVAACIISTAQQANPKVKGQNEPERAQAIIEISLVEIHSSFIKFTIFVFESNVSRVWYNHLGGRFRKQSDVFV